MQSEKNAEKKENLGTVSWLREAADTILSKKQMLKKKVDNSV